MIVVATPKLHHTRGHDHRRGKLRTYYRQGKGPRIPLPDLRRISAGLRGRLVWRGAAAAQALGATQAWHLGRPHRLSHAQFGLHRARETTKKVCASRIEALRQ
ncbi:hypothetical protein MOX02_34540 [Methylobacterium oxalidis]|uniref:Uncharacterized protein n=1 Tax=Methylobacterium oxalidis TaxID=944322 RepID=A0A512J618_9HYPH|nr:hypothetical protein MOX02_34540 [Methylobacterium oxalidis]GLS66306.1 hypothetical protein GCM10007888_46880 [Methylobacterium oxalidis]